MIVVTLTDCPISLRGDLAKWLVEINTGVFVGKVSARVRDNLWKRITDNVKNGRATMVFGTNNEQHMDFRVHNSDWIPIDFDGLKLVMRPSFSRTKALSDKKIGFSKASTYRMVQKKKNALLQKDESINVENQYPSDYVILDIETSGLNVSMDEIIEIGALRIKQNEIDSVFHTLIKPKISVPVSIIQLTGITNEMLEEDGISIETALRELIEFMGNSTILGHNVGFDINFLNATMKEECVSEINNTCVETMDMYSRLRNGKKVSRKLKDIAKYCHVEVLKSHRAVSDCHTVKSIYDVMRNKLEGRE